MASCGTVKTYDNSTVTVTDSGLDLNLNEGEICTVKTNGLSVIRGENSPILHLYDEDISNGLLFEIATDYPESISEEDGNIIITSSGTNTTVYFTFSSYNNCVNDLTVYSGSINTDCSAELWCGTTILQVRL